MIIADLSSKISWSSSRQKIKVAQSDEDKESNLFNLATYGGLVEMSAVI
jgi:hypothetical protein